MKRLLTSLVAFILCVTAISIQSCSDGKYTVWTETMTYADFQNSAQTTLEDGYHVKVEITNEQWKQLVPGLTNEGKHRWSEAEIKKWLIGYGFGEYEATKESSWLVMTDHGFLVTRESNLVHIILK